MSERENMVLIRYLEGKAVPEDTHRINAARKAGDLELESQLSMMREFLEIEETVDLETGEQRERFQEHSPETPILTADVDLIVAGAIVEARYIGSGKSALHFDVNGYSGTMPLDELTSLPFGSKEPPIGERIRCLVSKMEPSKGKTNPSVKGYLTLSYRAVLDKERDFILCQPIIDDSFPVQEMSFLVHGCNHRMVPCPPIAPQG